MNKITREDLQEARTAYERDGVACVRNVVGMDWIEQLRRGVDKANENPSAYTIDLTGGAADDPGDGTARSYWGDFSLWQRFDEFNRFMFESPLAAVTAAVVGTDRIKLFYDYLLVKQPSAGTKTPWHQDYPYYPVTGDAICSIFVALDPTTLHNGGLEYVAGSHLWGPMVTRDSFKGVKTNISSKEQESFDSYEQEATALPDIDADRSNYPLIDWNLEPGDVIIHHAMAVHCAHTNRSAAVRRGYAIRWIYGDVRYSPRAMPSRHLNALIEESEPPIASGALIEGSNFPVLPVS